MVKYQKDKNHEYAIAIKKNFSAGMKPIQIAKLFNISPQKVNYWIHHPIVYHKNRRMKLTRNERNIIIKWAKNKPINIASAKIIQRKFNYLSKTKKFFINYQQDIKYFYFKTKKNQEGFCSH